MLFGSAKGGADSHLVEVNAHQLDAMLREGEAVVVDVREVSEFVTGHIPGAVNVPLSSFDPTKLPRSPGKRLVLNCLGGKRSAMALEKCGLAQVAVDTHLVGGFEAWRSAGLPIEH